MMNQPKEGAMKASLLFVAVALPVSLLVGCQSSPNRNTSQGYSSAQQEKAMVDDMNLHRTGKTGQKAASRQDNAELRETITEHPVRSSESQATGGTVNEMVEGEGLPRPSDQGTRQPEPGTVEPGQRR
jgi:outer membrane murein-binding lipoprotein Lpp